MKIDDKIRNETLQYDINREAAKISVSPSGMILPSNNITF